MKRKGFNKLGPGAPDTSTIVDQEDDPIEDRRVMFGEVSSDSDDEENGYKSDDSVKAARGGPHGTCEEDEDEFMIVLQAVRERKKIEAESGKP
jgi:hypothetical protein